MGFSFSEFIPQQACFETDCPKLPEHVANGGGDFESSDDRAKVIVSCNEMIGPCGTPGQVGFQCGVLAVAGLYTQELPGDEMPLEGDER